MGGHFGEARSPLSLLFCQVIEPICGPIALIRNVSIFPFLCGFFLNPKASGVSLGSKKQGYGPHIFKNGRKDGHFGEACSPLPLLLC